MKEHRFKIVDVNGKCLGEVEAWVDEEALCKTLDADEFSGYVLDTETGVRTDYMNGKEVLHVTRANCSTTTWCCAKSKRVPRSAEFRRTG